MRRDVWSTELLRFCRCECLIAPELDSLEAERVQPVTRAPKGDNPGDNLRPQFPSGSAGRFKLAPLAATAKTKATAGGGGDGCAPGCLEEEATRTTQGDSSSGGGGSDRGIEGVPAAAHLPLPIDVEIVPQDTQSDDLSLQGSVSTKPKQPVVDQDGRRTGREGRTGDGGRTSGVDDGAGRTKREEGRRGEEGGRHDTAPEASCRFPDKPLSARNELAALAKAADYLVQARDGFSTTLEHDEARTVDEICMRSRSYSRFRGF